MLRSQGMETPIFISCQMILRESCRFPESQTQARIEEEQVQPEPITIATDPVYRLIIQRHALETGEQGRVLELV